jgi:hypothetical protein
MLCVPAAIAAKLSSIARPAPLDFSGWNWVPNTLPLPTTAANRSPCSAEAISSSGSGLAISEWTK